MRPIAVLPQDPDYARGMAKMLEDIKAGVPADQPQGDPAAAGGGPYHRWGPPLAADGVPASEAEFDSIIMQTLEACTVSMSHRVASRCREADTVARAGKVPTSLETFESTRLYCFTERDRGRLLGLP